MQEVFVCMTYQVFDLFDSSTIYSFNRDQDSICKTYQVFGSFDSSTVNSFGRDLVEWDDGVASSKFSLL